MPHTCVNAPITNGGEGREGEKEVVNDVQKNIYPKEIERERERERE
jgi:hypothetical protein